MAAVTAYNANAGVVQVPIDLEPGRYAFSVREDPSITGTLIVT